MKMHKNEWGRAGGIRREISRILCFRVQIRRRDVLCYVALFNRQQVANPVADREDILWFAQRFCDNDVGLQYILDIEKKE